MALVCVTLFIGFEVPNTDIFFPYLFGGKTNCHVNLICCGHIILADYSLVSSHFLVTRFGGNLLHCLFKFLSSNHV